MAVFERSFVVDVSLESVGSIIRLTLSVVTSHITWNSRIAECNPDHYFIDEQLRNQGPFKHWKYTHRFMTVVRGAQITDYVECEIPLAC